MSVFQKCINDAKVPFIDYSMISECKDHVSDDHNIQYDVYYIIFPEE